MATLNITVHVYDDDGRAHAFAPGVPVPDWATQKITNPDVWAVPPDHLGEAIPDGDSAGPSSAVPDVGDAGPPPMSGKGSGRDAWARYAAAHDVELPEGAGRDHIVAVLQDADVPTTE